MVLHEEGQVVKCLMKIFKNAGFVCLILGVGGMAGAIECGTGYLTSGILLIGGALMLYEYYREGEYYHEKNKDIVNLVAASVGTCRRGKSRRKGGGSGRSKRTVRRVG